MRKKKNRKMGAEVKADHKLNGNRLDKVVEKQRDIEKNMKRVEVCKGTSILVPITHTDEMVKEAVDEYLQEYRETWSR